MYTLKGGGGGRELLGVSSTHLSSLKVERETDEHKRREEDTGRLNAKRGREEKHRKNKREKRKKERRGSERGE